MYDIYVSAASESLATRGGINDRGFLELDIWYKTILRLSWKLQNSDTGLVDFLKSACDLV